MGSGLTTTCRRGAATGTSRHAATTAAELGRPTARIRARRCDNLNVNGIAPSPVTAVLRPWAEQRPAADYGLLVATVRSSTHMD